MFGTTCISASGMASRKSESSSRLSSAAFPVNQLVEDDELPLELRQRLAERLAEVGDAHVWFRAPVLMTNVLSGLLSTRFTSSIHPLALVEAGLSSPPVSAW